MKSPEFSLIICCYNEEDNLKKTISISMRVLQRLFDRFEIIIIEDNSQDRSPKIAESLSKKYPEVKVLHNSINLGQGISFLIGLKKSRGSLVMQNGADRPFDIRNLKKILSLFPEFDIVIIARRTRSAYSFWRKLTSWGNNILRWIFFGFEYSDLNFVQIYKRKVIRNNEVLSRRAAFVTQELIFRAKRNNFKIIEKKLPYHARRGGIAHHGKKRDILWALIDMFNFWLDWRKG